MESPSRPPVLGGALLVFLWGWALRVLPLLSYPVWGSDSGEYLKITSTLLSTGHLPSSYEGWGIVYPYFPTLEALVASLSLALGVDPVQVFLGTGPLLGALTPLVLFLLGWRAGIPFVPLLGGSLLLASASPHVLVTSHSIPGTFGHLLLVLALWATGLRVGSKSQGGWEWTLLLLVVLFLLVPTHHLTSFLLGAILLLYLSLDFLWGTPGKERRDLWGVLWAFLGFFSLYALSIEPFRERIVGDFLPGLGWKETVALFVLLLGAYLLLLHPLRRLLPIGNFDRAPPAGVWSALLLSALFLALLGMSVFTGVPGTHLAVTGITVVYALPLCAFLGGVRGTLRRTLSSTLGRLLLAWSLALLLALAFSAVLSTRVFPPYRFIDYLLEPALLLAAWGWWEVLGGERRASVLLAVALLLFSATSLPPKEAVGGYEEGILPEEVGAVLWSAHYLPPFHGVATDHRLSSLLFFLSDLHPTWDSAGEAFHGETWEEKRRGLENLSIPSGKGQSATYVLLSRTIREGVIVSQFETALPMSLKAWRLFFEDPHFLVIYSGGKETFVFFVEGDLGRPP